MRGMSVEVLRVSKRYGSQWALKKVGFIIEKPQVVALLGPNGAGKSTLMKIMTTYISPDEGDVRINGLSIYENPMEIRRITGYLPEHNPLYLNMFVFEYLEFTAGFYKVSKKRIFEAAEMTGLLPEAHKRIGQLSKGYRQRVGLAAAVVHNPAVMILDEPTTGLDPVQVVEIRNLIKELSKNKIILLSTHIMQEVHRIADRVIILNRGELILDKPVSELEHVKQTVVVEFDMRMEEEWLRRIPGITDVKNLGGNVWELSWNDEKKDVRSQIFDFAVRHDLKILRMETLSADWEEIFTEQVKK